MMIQYGAYSAGDSLSSIDGDLLSDESIAPSAVLARWLGDLAFHKVSSLFDTSRAVCDCLQVAEWQQLFSCNIGA